MLPGCAAMQAARQLGQHRVILCEVQLQQLHSYNMLTVWRNLEPTLSVCSNL